jgi:hypothetical protein
VLEGARLLPGLFVLGAGLYNRSIPKECSAARAKDALRATPPMQIHLYVAEAMALDAPDPQKASATPT